MHERVNNLTNSISDNEDDHYEEEDDVVTSRMTLEIKKRIKYKIVLKSQVKYKVGLHFMDFFL